jgi:hypothetical protein
MRFHGKVKMKTLQEKANQMLMELRMDRENFQADILESVMKQAFRQPINIIFDGPPGPESGCFVEVETDDGKSLNAGEWKQRTDGLWSLRITELPSA